MFGHDHVGHGESEGERVQISSFQEYTDPVISQCQRKKEEYPNVPLFIIGHSMGGLITLMAVLKEQDSSLFDGVVLMGPLIQIAPESASSFQKMLAKIASKVWPGLKVGSLDASNVTSDQVRGGKMVAVQLQSDNPGNGQHDNGRSIQCSRNESPAWLRSPQHSELHWGELCRDENSLSSAPRREGQDLLSGRIQGSISIIS